MLFLLGKCASSAKSFVNKNRAPSPKKGYLTPSMLEMYSMPFLSLDVVRILYQSESKGYLVTRKNSAQ